MSRQTIQRIAVGATVCAVLGSIIVVPLGALAQQDDRGGMMFKLRLAERFQWRETNSPDAEEDGTHTSLTTDIALSFNSETRSEAISLDFGAGYRLVDGPTTDGYEGRFSAPTLRLTYSQETASARFEVSATASSVELSETSPLDAPTVEGESIPVDFADLTESGTRQQLGFDGRLALRRDAPFGMIFGVSANDISYSDLPAGSGLNDRSSLQLTATGRFDVTKVLQVRAGLQYNLVDRDDEEKVQRVGLNGQAVLSRPDGNYRVSGNVADGDGGAQSQLTLGRRFELPQSVADIAFGMTRSATEGFVLTGSAKFEHEFGTESALGLFSATADRDVNFENGTDEAIVTSLALASNYALTPLANLRVSAEVAQSENLANGDTVDLAQAGVTVSYDFGRDWRANAGISAEMRDPSGAEASESTTLSLGVSRSFDLRR